MNKNIFYLVGMLMISSTISFAQLDVKVVSDSTVSGSNTPVVTVLDNLSITTDVGLNSSSSLFLDYSSNIKSNSDVIVEVTDEDDEVTVSFVEPVKLLGFFSVNMESDVSVDAESKVNVDRPFWAFLVTGKSDSSKIESDISAKVPQASVSGKLETNTKIQILNLIKSSIDGNVTASADVK